MDGYKKFLDVIQRFECKTIDPFKESSLTGNYVFGYPDDFDLFRDIALKSLPAISKRQIVLNLKKLTQARMEFSSFDHNYPDLLLRAGNTAFEIDHLKALLYPLKLKCRPIKKADQVFIKAFYEAFSYRLRSLVDLINKTEDFLMEMGLKKSSSYKTAPL
jgi:hypothetical protein